MSPLNNNNVKNLVSLVQGDEGERRRMKYGRSPICRPAWHSSTNYMRPFFHIANQGMNFCFIMSRLVRDIYFEFWNAGRIADPPEPRLDSELGENLRNPESLCRADISGVLRVFKR